MITISGEIEGVKELDRRLMISADNLEDFTAPFTSIERYLLNTWQMNFDARGGLFGGWPAAKKDYGHPLLEDTREMRDSFTSNVTSQFVEFGNSSDYFKFHQSSAPRTRLPRRVMMKLDQERKDQVVKTFQQWANDAIKKPS